MTIKRKIKSIAITFLLVYLSIGLGALLAWVTGGIPDKQQKLLDAKIRYYETCGCEKRVKSAIEEGW